MAPKSIGESCALKQKRGRPLAVDVATIEEFVHRIASAYLPHGYWFYVLGDIPERKDPAAVDRKLLDRYDAATSRWERARRKRAGRANVRYLRCGRKFILAATHGQHRFFDEEAASIRDARHDSIKVGGYSMSARAGHAHVRIELGEYRRCKAHFLELALRRSPRELADEFRRFPFQPYAPVRRQVASLVRAVNRIRNTAGLEAICPPTRVSRFHPP